MQEDFYATLKLVSGEEVFGKVCPTEEENRPCIFLENPVVFENIFIRHLDVNAIKIEPWIKTATDPLVVVHMDKIITMTEITDEYTIQSYERFIKNKDRESNKINETEKIGYLSSISNARKSFEKLFKL